MNAPCQDRISQLVRAGDGTLDAAQLDDLAQHMVVCAGCLAALDAQRFSHTLLSRAFAVDASVGLATRVVANIDEPDRGFGVLDFRRWTWGVGPLAAALLLAAWVVTGTATSAGQVTVTPTETAADAVLWSDAVADVDLVSIAWQDAVNAEVITSEGDGQ